MKLFLMVAITMQFGLTACAPTEEGGSSSSDLADGTVRIMTLDPGHFHAGLVHKYDYEQVDPVVHIYAPDGPELESHLALIERFNTRQEHPTHWQPVVYRGSNYLERMLADKPGNVMVVAGNNGRKTEYIRQAVEAGINVLADKPMAITPESFDVLKGVLASADRQGLLVNDIMTERHEITSILQRELSWNGDLFGEISKGSPEEPAISKESVHYFYKMVAGAPLVRPQWFYDVTAEGEGIVDVSTHLVDLILWQAFPNEPIAYEKSEDAVEVLTARSWKTPLSLAQFEKSTHVSTYPDFLSPYINADGMLQVAANGEFVFKVRGVHGKVSVRWNFENPEGGDTHFSIIRGSKANLVIRQDAAQNYRATLYVEPAAGIDASEFATTLNEALAGFADRYTGLTAEASEFGWQINIPEVYREGHEDHFTRVTEQYLDYLEGDGLPDWESTNLLTKYYITTQAFALSR